MEVFIKESSFLNIYKQTAELGQLKAPKIYSSSFKAFSAQISTHWGCVKK